MLQEIRCFHIISFQFVRNVFLLFPPLQLKDLFPGSQQGMASLGRALISPVLLWPSQRLRWILCFSLLGCFSCYPTDQREIKLLLAHFKIIIQNQQCSLSIGTKVREFQRGLQKCFYISPLMIQTPKWLGVI